MPRPPIGAQPDERTAKEGLGGLPPDPPPLDPDMKEDEDQSEQILTGENGECCIGCLVLGAFDFCFNSTIAVLVMVSFLRRAMLASCDFPLEL